MAGNPKALKAADQETPFGVLSRRCGMLGWIAIKMLGRSGEVVKCIVVLTHISETSVFHLRGISLSNRMRRTQQAGLAI